MMMHTTYQQQQRPCFLKKHQTNRTLTATLNLIKRRQRSMSRTQAWMQPQPTHTVLAPRTTVVSAKRFLDYFGSQKRSLLIEHSKSRQQETIPLFRTKNERDVGGGLRSCGNTSAFIDNNTGNPLLPRPKKASSILHSTKYVNKKKP